MQYKVAITASYFACPEVLEILDQQDLILTTHGRVMSLLVELFPHVRIICANNAGGWNDKDLLTVVNLFSCHPVVQEDLVVTHFGHVCQLGDKYEMPADVLAKLSKLAPVVIDAAEAIRNQQED